MPKRLTDSEKWADPWFGDLTSNQKLTWIYLLDNCDHAGIWKVHRRLAEFHLGFEFSLVPFEGRFFQLSDEKIFIPGFIDFQYGTLNESNRVHKSVIDRLKKLGAYKALVSPFQGAKEKEKEKEKDKEKEKTARAHVNNIKYKEKNDATKMVKLCITLWNNWPQMQVEQSVMNLRRGQPDLSFEDWEQIIRDAKFTAEPNLGNHRIHTWIANQARFYLEKKNKKDTTQNQEPLRPDCVIKDPQSGRPIKYLGEKGRRVDEYMARLQKKWDEAHPEMAAQGGLDV